jgi:signal transduction histidine kinase
MLKPVKILETGVKELSSGNIKYRMKTDGNDELGELIISFNLMASEINKMISARDQLLMDVSHELRSPLTRIKVALEFIEESNAKNSILDDISDIEKMVNELLETERLNSPYGVLEREKIELVKLIQGIEKDFVNVKPGLKIEKPKNKYFIYADTERLKILFKNIIGNALKFSDEQTKPVEIILYEENNNTITEIKDYGKGIPEKEIRNIFEPFYRVDKSRSKNTGGYGLGMSLSKKIVEAHGGEITVKSTPGKGTTVSLRFKTD